MTRQYRAAAGPRTQCWGKTVGFWTRGARTVTDLVPGRPRVDLVPAVERYFELVQRTVDINRRLTVRWAQALGYEGLAKAELSDQLAKRELPKTGNVDALIERLVEADSK